MFKIIIVGGNICLVDESDFERVSKHRWKMHPQGYAYRKTSVKGKTTAVLMHRFIMGAPLGMEVDHIHGIKLDNRRSELAMISPLDHRRKHVHILVAHQKAAQIYPDAKPCVVCGKVFTVNPRKRKRNKCCGAACASSLRAEGRKNQSCRKLPRSSSRRAKKLVEIPERA